MNNGPTMRTIPTQSFRVCDGCQHLNKVAGVYGHKSVSHTYLCNHPDYQSRSTLMYGKGKTIHHLHEGECITPDWCPILNSKRLVNH